MRILSRGWPLVFALAAASSSMAGTVAAPPARSIEWSLEPAILSPILLTTLWYLIGLIRLRRLPSLAQLFTTRRAAAFLGGELTLVLALLSPLDSIADQLFSVHMVQHMLLLLVAAPLLVMGRPAIAFLWAFGPVGRKRLGRVWSALGLRAGIGGLMNPLVVWTLFCGVFILWHFPGPYQWALRNENIHTLEHVSFLVAALMFWTVVIEPSGHRRLTYGATLLFILTAAILSSLPGAIITLSVVPLYPDYAAGTAAWGLTLIQDQQLAGLVMWIPGGVVYLVAMGHIFLKWLQLDDSRRPRRRLRSDAISQRPLVTQEALGSPSMSGSAGTRALLAVVLCSCLAALLSGCGSRADASIDYAVGNPQRGMALIRAEGCGTCHIIPGINDATGLVGPPLDHMGQRIFIAGLLRNTPENMIQWLRDPQSVLPGNAMPNMEISDADARDIAAYLYTLQ